MTRALVIAVAALGLCAATAHRAAADDASAQWQLGTRGTPHAGVPFALVLVVAGFEQAPAPELPKVEVAGARITPLGATPQIQQLMELDSSGRRTVQTLVTWVLKYRVDAGKPGRLRVPATTVAQNGKRATAAAAELEVDSVPIADDMKLALELPTRPVFLGETVKVTLRWLFRRQPSSDPSIALPISGDDVTISAPAVTDPRRALAVEAGDKSLQAPYKVADKPVEVDGVRYTQLELQLLFAPRRAGKLELAPASVLVELPGGRTDYFGFAQSQLYRATDTAHVLDVKPLPETDRPASFAGAVGSQFSIAVATSRSVVSLGDPVELAIKIRSDQPLDALALPRLDGEGGLPRDRFAVPAELPTGELSDDGKTKTFKVTVQVTGAASELPALAFSYFDPQKSVYQTIHSDPIALSVKGGNVVGVNDVVAVRPSKPTTAAAAASEDALVGAELALSSAAQVDDHPLGGGALWLVVGLLYAVPLVLLGARSWQLRTAARREDAAEVRLARRRVYDALDRAERAPARDAAGPLAAALRGLAKALERDPDDGPLLTTLETESFAPAAAASPLSPELRARVDATVRRWTAEARRKRGKPVPTAALTGVALVCGLAGTARAEAVDALIDRGRRGYEDALALRDPSTKRAAFARAEIALGDAAASAPDRPELLADWGTAALQAGDVATATLAYRRALAVDGGNARARKNLAWLRGRQPETLRPAAGSASDALFFFHQWLRSQRIVVGAVAFALAVLLVVPWSRRRRALRAIAALPCAVWLAMTLSVVLEDRHVDDAVVMDEVVLRAADSAGAPAAMASPLPRGTEVTVVERRDAWTKIRVANGTAGWVPGDAIARIALQDRR